MQKLRGEKLFFEREEFDKSWHLNVDDDKQIFKDIFFKSKVMYSYKHNNKSFNKPFTNSIIYTLSMYKYFFQMTNLPPEF